MFDNLSERLERSFKILKGEGRITEINVAETLKDVRKALLEADVNYKVAKTFTDTVKAKALGQNVLTALKPSQVMIKIVHDELTALMGGEASDLKLKTDLSIILMSMAIVMECQMKHMLERPSGCSLDDILYLSTDFSDNDAIRFLDKLRALPCVESAGACQSIPGAIGSSYVNPDKDGNKASYWFMKCDSATFNMLGFDIVEQYGQTVPGAVWLSESAAATSGTDHAHTDLSKTVSYDYKGRNIATGIVKDFIIMDAGYSEKTENGIIFIVRPEELWSLSYAIKTEGDHAQARRMITECYEAHCREVFGITVPAWINDYMTDYLENSLEGARRTMKMVEMFMILAIVLSLSGLVAISIFYADGNRKSIALHKVYGGTYGSEMLRNIRTYMVMALIAAAISIPVSVILSERYLQEFAWRIDSYGWIFAVTALLSLLFTAASVIWQVSRAARTDPAEALKTE